jgi:hypothetical protein
MFGTLRRGCTNRPSAIVAMSCVESLGLNARAGRRRVRRIVLVMVDVSVGKRRALGTFTLGEPLE